MSADEIRQRIRAAMEPALAQQRLSAARMQTSTAVQRPVLHPAVAGLAAPAASVMWEPAPPPNCDPLSPQQGNRLIHAVSQREGLDPELLRAVVWKESGFRPCAVSPKGALGLMQLMPDTALALGVADPLDPTENLASGARFLKQLMLHYGGNLALALGAYNAGPATVDRLGEVPDYPETLEYVRQILGALGWPDPPGQ